MNQIIELQNSDKNIELLRARQCCYGTGTAIVWLQLFLNLIIPFAITIHSIYLTDPVWATEVRGWGAAYAFTVLLIDIWLDRSQKLTLRKGALLGEQFDCNVLGIGWNHFNVGQRVEEEDVISLARTHATKRGKEKLIGWYPEEVAPLPLHIATVICQRTNLHYDGKLRRSLSNILLFATCIAALSILLAGLSMRLAVQDLSLLFAPALPFLSWSLRESFRHSDTAAQQEKMKKEIIAFWEEAVKGDLTVKACQRRSRQFQDAIFARRASSPLILPFVYSLKRDRFEDEMHRSAAQLVDQYRGANAA